MLRLGLIWTTVALAAALLTGCGGSNPRPKPYTPTTSAAASPTAPPTLPDAAKGTTPESAEAFVRYFVDSLNYAGATGEVAGLQTTYEPSCGCAGIAEFITRIYSAGGHVEGTGWRVISMATSGTGTDLVATARVDVGAQTIVRKAGATPRHFEGGKRLRKVFYLSPRGDSWTILKIEQPDG